MNRKVWTADEVEQLSPAVAQILTLDLEEGIHLRVLEGDVADHRNLLSVTA